MPDLNAIFATLLKAYGPLHWWPAETPFEVAIGALLTQNTNWKNVEIAIDNLRREEALTPQAIAALQRQELEQLIRPSGFFRQKAERLQHLAEYLQTAHNNALENLLNQPLELARRELLQLKGIGPETADSILLYAGNLPSFVVDAYTMRLFQRLGSLTGKEGYEQVRNLFMSRLPADPEIYNEYHALIVEHCKRFCRKRPLCQQCPLQNSCRHAHPERGQDP
ncbi:MAG: endonuclease III domain-containing protein [Desulfuromonadales bacterium]|nr:endonuclease III domain-containing protein [Desulfuromonadales bacterium]